MLPTSPAFAHKFIPFLLPFYSLSPPFLLPLSSLSPQVILLTFVPFDRVTKSLRGRYSRKVFVGRIHRKGSALYPLRLKDPLNSILYETLHEQQLM
jgi:hypothetical protein